MPAKRSASRAEVSDDDLLSGSDGNEVSPPPPKKAARATPAGRGKGSSSASGGAKTVAAPARRPAPAATPASPLVDDDDDDDDDDDLSQGGSSGMLNIDLVATLQGTLQRQDAKIKADQASAAKMFKEQKEAAFLKHQEMMLKLVEKYKTDYAKHVQATDKIVSAKMTASQQAQAKTDADLKKLNHDLAKSTKHITAGQRYMAEAQDDFKATAERIVKDHETQTTKVVDEARRKSIAEIDSKLPLDEVFKSIEKLSSHIQRQLPAGIMGA